MELQLASGPGKWITVARHEKVFDAVAERLQCRRLQLNRIEFGGVSLPPTKHLTFKSIDIDDGGRLGVDYSDVVRLNNSFLSIVTVLSSSQLASSNSSGIHACGGG